MFTGARAWIVGIAAATLILAWLGLFPLTAAAQAVAPPRVGLVIANSAYANPADALPGARRDGHRLKAALEKVGFRVTLVQDASKAQMEASLKAFQRALRDAGPTAVGLVYYAGHGNADPGRQDNFLLPVDVQGVAGSDVANQGVGVRWITDLLRNLDERQAISVVVDACRSVAAGPDRGKPTATAGSAPSLDMIEPEELPDRGYLVAYSTSKGRVASDSGYYSEVLAAKLTTPGLTLDQVFEQVRQEVASRTPQLPTSRSTLVAKVCLAGCGQVGATDALAVLKLAVSERGVGDVGQIAAIRQLANEGRSLAGFELKGLYLKGADLDKVDFGTADMDGAMLDQARLNGTVLSKARLWFASLNGAQARNVDLRDARLYLAEGAAADFAQAEGRQSNWQGASLRGASFRGAKLQGASFMLADVRDADFRGADLSGAFFIGALLTGAKFDEAVLSNTDMTGAVGEARQFTKAQQAALCATENSRGFRLRLVRVIKSNRFPSGEEYQDLMNEYVDLGSGLSNLDRCAHRGLKPAGATTVSQVGEREETASETVLHLAAELLDRAGRQRQFIERARATVSLLNTSRKEGPHVRVSGEQHRRLLSALMRNVATARLESPAVLDGDAFTMYTLRFQPDAMAAEHWRDMAIQWARKEANGPEYMRRNFGNQWPLFFPARTSASELAAEHVEAFKQWTLNRARSYPTRVILEGRNLPHVRQAVLQQGRGAPAATAVVRPLPGYIMSTGAPQIPPSIVPLLDKGSTYLSARHGGWSAGDAVIQLPRGAESYEMRVPPQAFALVESQSVGLRMKLEVRGLKTLRAGKDAMTILEANIAELELTDSQGQPLR
jgi:uncharacterized protein YjbI with pentapeptide repeats